MAQRPPADEERTVIPGAPTPSPAHADHHNALPLGTRIGEFEVAGLVGVGGFGIVYLAQDHSLDRRVALKEYMPSELAQREPGAATVSVKSQRHAETFNAGMRSFINEARILAQFDHPSLVKVYRFWEANGTAYMVMPFYEGVTLKETLKRAGEAPDESWLKTLLAQLLDALEIIHARQCYHRDIAPDNILILPDETPLLLDFGAARRVIGDMTQALTVILKPGYAPIEQYAEAPNMRQGPWTDLYALASVVYFAIVGRAPVPAVARVMSDPLVPLAQAAAGRYSDAFLRGIDAALAVKPEDRPQNVAAFRETLGFLPHEPATRYIPPPFDAAGPAESTVFPAPSAARTQPPAARAPEPKRRGRYVAAVLAVLALLIAGGAAYMYLDLPFVEERIVQTPPAAEGPAVPEIEAKLVAFDCARLEAAVNGNAVAVRGHVSTQSDLDRIDDEVATVQGVRTVDYSAVRIFPRPYCSVVNALAPHARHTPQTGSPAIALKDRAGEAFEGEPLRVEIVAPAFDAFVYADLYDPEANVVHLLPNAGQAKNQLKAKQRLALGDDPLAGAQWEVVPPLGKHLLVVMASESRLFDRERPQVEDVFGYLRAIRDSAAAQAPGAKFVVHYELVDFVPKR